ncbi:hypothetical protein HYALB_00011755 [Hymenoscyphus albidus]|uniref:Uncharacterized protein n=1 Tax=Hymenoscyphus albidus TaxID=595503 RepID=A0A9N9Q852_9HELO|nr:hypothetical protein HYALB_00011755 [Hymenoscyphus albidus]
MTHVEVSTTEAGVSKQNSNKYLVLILSHLSETENPTISQIPLQINIPLKEPSSTLHPHHKKHTKPAKAS